MSGRPGRALSALLLIVWSGQAEAGPVEIAPPLTEGAVLQRGAEIVVTGQADPSASLIVRLGEDERTVLADGAGAWTTRFAPFDARFDPIVLTVTDEHGHDAVVSDLLVGDVFLAAGQSNMAWQLQHAAGNNAVLRRRAAPDGLRLYREPPRCASEPRPAAGRWTGSGWDDAKRFSAIGYHFGRAYAAAEGVPVGVVLAARGGSPIDAWLPPDRLPSEEAAERAETLNAQDRQRADFASAMPVWLARYANDPAQADEPPSWPMDDDLRHLPGCYWDGMLAGLGGTPIAGVIWYQGETDAYDGTTRYDARLATLLGAFRRTWDVDLAVVVIGLPPYEPVSTTAMIRAAQDAAASGDARTALVPADDPAADPLELHPRPKRGPAERAAASMRALRLAK